MHDILIQQLIRHFGSLEDVPEALKPFLEEIDRTYARFPVSKDAGAAAKPAAGQGEYRISKTKGEGKAGNGQGTVAIPIQLRGQTLGAINLNFEDSESARNTAPLVQQLSNRLALAMDNARLFQETQNSLARTNALLEVSRAAMSFESTAQLLETTAEAVRRTLNPDRIVIRRIDTSREEVLHAVGAGPGVHHSPLELPYEDLMDSLHGWAVRERRPALSPKGTPDPRDTPNGRQLRVLANSGAILIVPLVSRDGVLGLITAVNTPEQANFQPQDEELLSAMANQVTTALENAHLVEEQQRRLQELSVLFEGSRIFSTAPTDLAEASRTIASYFSQVTGANTVAVGFLHQAEAMVQFLAAASVRNGEVTYAEDPSRRNYSLLQNPVARRVLDAREPVSIAIGDPEVEPAESAFILQSKLKTLAVLPMASKGQTIGLIELAYTDQVRRFSQERLNYFNTLTNQAAATLDNLQLLRTQQQRALELQTAAEVSRAASSILDVEELLPRTVELIGDRFNLYYTGIFLVDETGDWAVLRAGTGEAGRRQMESGHRLRVGDRSMIGRCIATGEAQIYMDIGESAVRYPNPDLPETRSEMALPLTSRGRRIGAMTIQSTAASAFSDENIATLQTMADQLANAIENARLFEQAQLQNKELDQLNQMGRALTATLDREAITESIYKYTAQLMEFDSFLVAFYRPDDELLHFPIAVENEAQLDIPDQPLGEGLVAHVVRSRSALLVSENMDAAEAELGIRSKTVGETPVSWLGVPLFSGGEVVGVISVQSTTTPRQFNERSRDLLISIANQASNALQITSLFEQAQRQADDLAVLNEMSRALSIRLDVDTVVQNIYDYATRLLGTSNLFIALYNNDTRMVDFKLAVTDEGKQLVVPPRVLGSGLMDYVIHSRKPLLLRENAEREIERMGLKGITLGDPPLSWLAVPVILGNEVIGVIGTQSVTTPRRFDERHRDLLVSIAGQAAIALQNASLFRQAQQQTDDLAVLNEMSRELSTQLDLDHVVENIYRYTARLIGTPNVFVALYEAEQETIRFPVVVDDGERIEVPPRQLSNGLTDYVIRKQIPLILRENAEASIQELGLDSVLIGDPPESWLGVPILLGRRTLGMIGTQSVHSPDRYTDRGVDLVTSIAGQAAIALQNASLFRQAQRQNEDLLILNEMSRELATKLDALEIVETLYEYTARLIDPSNFYIALYDEETDILSFPLVTVGTEGERTKIDPQPLGTGLTDHVIRTREPLLLKRFQEEDYEALGIEPQFYGDDKPAVSWLGVPMLSGGRTVGVISVQSTETPGLYSERDRDLLTAIANQAVSALQNARLFSQSQRQNHDLAVLNEMSRVLSATLNVEEVVEIVFEYASKVLDTRIFHMVFYEADSGTIHYPLVVNHGDRISIPSRPFGNRGLNEYVIRSRTPLLVPDRVAERMDELGLETVHIGDDSFPVCWMGVPMSIGTEVIGTISLQSTTTPRLFVDYDRDLLTSIAGQAAIAIQNARLFGEAQKRAAQLQTAAEVAREATESLNLDELLPRAVELIRDRFGFYHASVFLLDNSRRNAYVQASTGEAGEELIAERHSLPVGSQSVIGSVTFTGQPLVINDITQDEIHRPNPLLPDTRAELGIPLKVGDRVIGAMDVQATQVNAFTPDDVAVLTTLADQIAVAVDNSRTYELAQAAFQSARERAQEMTSLYDFSHQLTVSALQTREVVETALTALSEYLGDRVTCSISLLEEETATLRVLSGQVIEDGVRRFAEDLSSRDVPLESHPAFKRVMDNLRSQKIDHDMQGLEEAEKTYLKRSGGDSIWLFPLPVKGRSLGLLEVVDWATGREIGGEQLNLIGTMATQTAAALENALLYDEQIRTAEQLRELDTLKNQFLANMSHELRTPLNSIIGFSRVILKGIDGPVTDLQQQDLTAIYNAGQHLLGLINDILDLSRIEAGKMELNFEQIDIESLVTSVMATARGLVKEKKISLEQEVAPSLPPVTADATRIRQILLNLLQNAAKFTDSGFIRVIADTEQSPAGERFVRISVQDSGIGISEEDQQRLFQPFTQVDSSTTRRVGGTGLGLSISRNLINLHGGEIGVRSAEGEGSTFYFTLPFQPELEPDVPVEERRTVLAIDDDPRVIELYSRYLDSRGYRVIPVADPAAAVAMAIEHRPFAITLDVMMPSRNGWQVIQDLKANPETREIPVIFCTMIEDEARGFSLGASDYLLKPILEEDLIKALVRLEASRDIKKILVVDDDPDVLRLVERTLKPTGMYELILAQGGRSGLKALDSHTPDVILLDLLMDDLDGFNVIEAMQKEERLRRVPIIIVTGHDLTAAEEDSLSAYAANLIKKGNFKGEQLIDTIAEILDPDGSSNPPPNA